jgi:hypothetical protein
MSEEQAQPTPEVEGSQPEALSNAVLKLKIDDLFQEIEHLKRRVDRLEGRPSQAHGSESKRKIQAPGIVSDPDRPP